MKTVLITGASRGIGLATAKLFLEKGWKVIGTSTSGKLPIKHENLTALKLDLSDDKSIEVFSKKIIEDIKNIDVLVNNAAVSLDPFDVGVNLEKVRKTFEVNLFGLIDLTEKLLPIIKENGHIININSRYGSQSMPIDDDTSIGYRMSKASLNMYTRFLAFRLKEKNIYVSSLNPGWTKTDMGMDAATEEIGPDREPQEPAKEIFDMANKKKIETGQFWYKGQKHDW